ncbi:MAG: hypothetical protein ACR2IJ_00515 [Fluviibacter sp.]
MAEYTKGPWQLDSESLRGDSYTAINGEGWDELATVVTRMKLETKDSAEGLANARLIAAAPELLEALEGMVAMFADHAQYDEDGHEIAAVTVAQMAIAKAKGQA